MTGRTHDIRLIYPAAQGLLPFFQAVPGEIEELVEPRQKACT